jgi:hypothetical protein
MPLPELLRTIVRLEKYQAAGFTLSPALEQELTDAKRSLREVAS